MSLDPTKTLAFSPLHRLQWEDAQQRYVILYPEGMVELNLPSAEILKLCDGQHNAQQIVAELEAKFEQTGLQNDIFGFLDVALAKNWIDVAS
jgi:pyrroloquinoline quinone biosynthesis protein D